MATLNDFKLVNIYSKELLKRAISSERLVNITESNMKRFGFYFLLLQLTTGNANVDEIEKMINDSDYCNQMGLNNKKDYGIDAVYIDDEKNRILLYNFKFLDSFKFNAGGKQGPFLDSLKFLNMAINGDFNYIDISSPISESFMKEIYTKLSSDEIWNIELIIASNENHSLDVSAPEIESLINEYGIEIKPICLDDIMSFLYDRSSEYSAKFFVDKDSFLVYEEDSLASAKSYLVKLSVLDLVRITCSDAKLRDKFDFDCPEKIKDMKLELGVLYENIRGYLGTSKYNKNIIKTLRDEPSKFFIFNNGITITAKNVKSESRNANKKYLFTLEDMQVVNGGQTLRSIYEFKDKEFDEEKLVAASVLVRVFKTEDRYDLINEIAEYTNSQNAISDSDLKSINTIQIKIEKYLEKHGIDYVRKVGDIGKRKNLNSQISKERLAQILYSYQGFPHRATNQKSKLFGIYYDEIFDEETLDFEHILKMVTLYNVIENKYKEIDDKVYAQKILYIVYLFSKSENIENNISLLEKALNEYIADEKISDARKLIQKGFKDFLDSSFESNAI